MKIALLLLFLSIQVKASMDEIPSRSTGQKLPKKTFERIITIFETVFAPYAQVNGRELEFLTDYDEDWIQAFARRWETDQVIVYGGVAAIKNGSEDTMALILCHETGHLYGGVPYSDEFNKMSVEGQADYWAASHCLDKILPLLSVRIGETLPMRKINAFLAVTAQFALNRNLPAPRLDTPDQTVVEATNQTHPNPQCRLDTFLAGMNALSRPACWYKK